MSAFPANPHVEMIGPIVDAFFKPEKARLDRGLVDLVKENHSLGGHPYGFFYNGKLFSPAAIAQLRGQKITQVLQALEDAARKHLALNQTLTDNQLRLRQSLTVVATRCRAIQDFRDSLPEPLVKVAPDLAAMPRHRAEGAVLDGDPVLRGQFEKVIRICLYYTANRLLY